ncbi:NEDD4-binding protein 2 [Electrophorus electricus]|uniref:NEDD4-binding protein 2 n=1 Tax=Electrophorus electricus TaxID=8005 RepID=UPI0015D08CF9|nr:NEDD4-binding protein 2 [Electrophorus electricus]
MPKRKKNGLSPNRVSAQTGEYRSVSDVRVQTADGASLTRVAPRDQGNAGSMLPTSNQSSFQGKDEIVKRMQEMFSHLDPVVIDIVLSEADFKVENAMDALLELSDAAEGKPMPPPPLSGFEMAAALLDPRTPKTEPATVASESSSASEVACLTEEFDSLIDLELESLKSLQSQPSDHPSPSSVPLSSLHLPSQSVCPSSLPAQNIPPGHPTISVFEHLDMGNLNGGTSPKKELSFGGVSVPNENDVSVDYSHLTEDSSSDGPRPSAFKAYRRPDQFMNLKDITSTVPYSEGLHTPAMFWNIQAPEFQPCAEGPTFITPIMQASNRWSTFSAAQWLAPRPFSQAPLKPSATIPKSWTLPSQSRLRLEGQVLVLLRGAPGSGKTTLASAMLEQNPSGVVLSTDEYFIQNGVYHFNPELLGEAHAWNHQRAREAFETGLTPIIIDNTNLQCWEMKPYVAMALKHTYRVLFREPDTWWKTKPKELEKRTKHGVTKEKIRRMLEHQDRYVSVKNIMSSQPKVTAIFGVDVDVSQTDPAQKNLMVGLCCPDLVGDPGFVKPGGHLSSSLPDVSSVAGKCSPSSANICAETELHRSKEFIESCQMNSTEQVGMPQPELLDGANLDWEIDACVSQSQIWELNKDINEDPGMLEERVLDQPVVFSTSIGQRVRRERDRNRFADKVVISQQPLNFELNDCSEKQVKPGNDAKEDCIVGSVETVGMKPELLNFVGDWPCASLKQRAQRDWKSVSQTLKTQIQSKEKSNFADDISKHHDGLLGHSDCNRTNKTECQKNQDLLQGDDNHLSQETTRDSPTFSEKKKYPGIEAHCVLPDCVLDWKSGKSTDCEKDSTHSQSPTKELETGQGGYSNKDAQKANMVVESQANAGKGVGNRVSEETYKPCLTADTTLSSGGLMDHNAEASQERWRGPGRRPGKSCRLALTFTNQSPTSVCISADTPVTLPKLSITMPPLESHSTAQTCSSQTDAQDFSLLWRINHQKYSEPEGSTRGVVVLEGNPFRFVPETFKGINPGQQEVPYRMCHEKGSQVEESDLRELPFKQHSLEILSHYFKHVPMETLEDLYEKCYQDMEWTTNLLLDSGEQFYKDDEEDGLDPLVDKEVYLAEFTKDCQVTGQLRESLAASAISSEWSGGQIAELAIRTDYRSSVGPGAGEYEDSKQNDLGRASEDIDKCLEHQLKGPMQEGTVEALKCMSKASVTHPYQSVVESRKQQDTLLSDSAEAKTAPPDEVTSVLQRQIFNQYLECGEEVEGEEKKEEEKEMKEETHAVMGSLLAKLEEMEQRQEEDRKKKEKESSWRSGSMDIKILELKLPTELALQLTELFGSVGISPGEFSPEDCSVLMDLNFAKLLHQKWKETIQNKHRQAALSYHLLQESSVSWGEPQPTTVGQRDSAAHFLIGAEGYLSGVQEGFPFMDHWNVSHPRVSLRDIMIEEQVMQDSLQKSRLYQHDLDKKDGATKLKENQLFTLFPTIDRHFLRDIFTNNNYSLEQTEQFLHALLDDGPVRNIVAPKISPDHEAHRVPYKEKKWKQKEGEPEVALFQDTEDPEYEDFRTEAMLQRQRQQECFSKAAEAYRQGCKDVASFYAQQGRLHGQKMKEANHRAAVQIFERVNATLLPQNVLDLHGLHVDEALQHLQLVLADKTSDWQQGLCRPQLSVITGRGNRSQGGVARIRPAVLDYLKSKHYRYSEPKPGLMLVTLH